MWNSWTWRSSTLKSIHSWLHCEIALFAAVSSGIYNFHQNTSIPSCSRMRQGKKMRLWGNRQLIASGKTATHRRLNLLVDGLREPWQQQDEKWDDWERTTRNMRNLSAGILWLLIARGLITRCFRPSRSRWSPSLAIKDWYWTPNYSEVIVQFRALVQFDKSIISFCSGMYLENWNVA